MTQTGKKRTSKCPACGENIYIKDQLRLGQIVICTGCEEELEIIKIDPIVLDWVYIPDGYESYYDEELEFGYRDRRN